MSNAWGQKEEELARIIVAYSDKIIQLTVNQKMVTPLMVVALQTMIVDCIAEVMNALSE